MAAPLLMSILTLTILEDVKSLHLSDVQDWSKFHIDIFNFDIKNNSTYLYEVLECCRSLAGLSYGNTLVIDSEIEQSLYHTTLLCIFSEN